jgi:hypothetical protein
VTNGNGTVTSSSSFIIGSSLLSPAISGFTPQMGVAGTAVTITGNNFQTTTAKNKISFSGVNGIVSTAASGVLGTSVPSASSSGKISVSTPFGTIISANDFFVPPAGMTVASIASTGRITIDGAPLTVSVASAGKIAMVLFDGVANQQVSLQPSGTTFPSYCGSGTISWTGPAPNGSLTAIGSFCAEGSAFVLPTTGTYTLIITPSGTDTGSVTIKLQNAPTVVAPITIGGPAVTVSTTVPAQQAQLTFTSTSANQIVSLQISGYTYPSDCGLSTLLLIGPAPETTSVGSSSNLCAGSTAYTLPTVGTYTLTVQPSGTDTGSVTLQLN